MTTIKDIARLADVSISTVSIVLNGQSELRKISSSTRDRVLAASKELNYSPNISARKLRSNYGADYTIGIYWATQCRNEYLMRVLGTIQRELSQTGNSFNIVIRPFLDDALSRERALKGAADFNGAIIATTSKSDMEYLENNIMPVPIVLFNRRSPIYSSVTADNWEIGRMAAIHACQCGVKNMGAVFTKSTESHLSLIERRKAFLDTCRERGVTIAPQHVFYCEDTLVGGGAIAEEFVRLPQFPQAVFCDDDSAAAGFMSVLHQKGILIPEQFKIISIGMNSADFSNFTVPPLTVAELPLDEMAQQATILLLKHINHEIEGQQHIVVPSRLLVRQSFE